MSIRPLTPNTYANALLILGPGTIAAPRERWPGGHKVGLGPAVMARLLSSAAMLGAVPMLSVLVPHHITVARGAGGVCPFKDALIRKGREPLQKPTPGTPPGSHQFQLEPREMQCAESKRSESAFPRRRIDEGQKSQPTTSRTAES